MSFGKRFLRLFKKVEMARSDGDRYTQIVNDYFDAGNHNVVELCDAIGMTPRQLYFAVNTDRARANILPRLPEKMRAEVVDEISLRMFGEQAVKFTAHTGSAYDYENLNEVSHYLDMQRNNVMLTENLKELPPVKAYIHSLTPEAVRFAVNLSGRELNLGIVSDITRTQLNLLMVKYGKLNPRGNRQCF